MIESSGRLRGEFLIVPLLLEVENPGNPAVQPSEGQFSP